MSDDPILPDWLPYAHFGSVGAVPSGVSYDDLDPDDEELAETPPEIATMLGFDPAGEPDA